MKRLYSILFIIGIIWLLLSGLIIISLYFYLKNVSDKISKVNLGNETNNVKLGFTYLFNLFNINKPIQTITFWLFILSIPGIFLILYSIIFGRKREYIDY